MIASKPSSSTITSFALFLVLSVVIVGMNLITIIQDSSPAWYTYIIVAILTPVILFVVVRIFINYKVFHFGDNKIVIEYKTLKKRLTYSLKDVEYWKEAIVKTGKNSTFKEVEIRFSDKRKFTLGHREFTNYSAVIAYLSRRLGGKKVAES